VTFRVLMLFIGPIWAVCGVVMAISPPLDGRRGQASPAIGAAIAMLGVMMVVAALRSMRTPDRPARHARGEKSPADFRKAVVMGLAPPIFGGIVLWAGIADSLPAVISLGVIAVSAGAFAIPLLRDSLGSRR
jgi:hypothetical protein